MFFLKFIFWSTVIILFMVYQGYGILLNFILYFKRAYFPKKALFEPIKFEKIKKKVTVLLTVHNEAIKIKKRIYNLMDTSYPREHLNVLVASDGSNDTTHNIMRKLKQNSKFISNLDLFISTSRLGKTGTQNKAVSICSGEIIIITDADTIFDRSTISNLVNPFYDTNVGCVSGRIVFDYEDNSISKSQAQYWDYESRLRQSESDLGILVVAGGPCMALRKEYFEKMPEFAGEDCVIPIQMALKGKKNIYNPNAVAFDKMDSQISKEINIRSRMTLRNWMGTLYYKKILNPINYPGYAFSLLFHKIFRWLSPFLIIILTLSIYFIALHGEYLLPFILITLVYIFGLVGYVLGRFNIKAPIVSSVSSFFIANYGFAVGLVKLLARKKITLYRAGNKNTYL